MGKADQSRRERKKIDHGRWHLDSVRSFSIKSKSSVMVTLSLTRMNFCMERNGQGLAKHTKYAHENCTRVVVSHDYLAIQLIRKIG